MSIDKSALLGHLAYTICNARVNIYPFPHIYIENVFPWPVYDAMLANLPPEGDYSSGVRDYNGRKFADPTAIEAFAALNDPFFTQVACIPFLRFIQQRFPGDEFAHRTDLRLVRDRINYAIGPHTDAPRKVLSYLFYLPSDNLLQEHGTSIYIANDPSFRCTGGPHYPFEHFLRIHTAPFKPNSMFAFFKTNYSFHGVEPITIPCVRDVLLWNLYSAEANDGKAPT